MEMQLGFRLGGLKGFRPVRSRLGLAKQCLQPAPFLKHRAVLATLERAPGSRHAASKAGQPLITGDAPAQLTGFQAIFLTAFAALMAGIGAKR
jgi:hypothetical protein